MMEMISMRENKIEQTVLCLLIVTAYYAISSSWKLLWLNTGLLPLKTIEWTRRWILIKYWVDLRLYRYYTPKCRKIVFFYPFFEWNEKQWLFYSQMGENQFEFAVLCTEQMRQDSETIVSVIHLTIY